MTLSLWLKNTNHDQWFRCIFEKSRGGFWISIYSEMSILISLRHLRIFNLSVMTLSPESVKGLLLLGNGWDFQWFCKERKKEYIPLGRFDLTIPQKSSLPAIQMEFLSYVWGLKWSWKPFPIFTIIFTEWIPIISMFNESKLIYDSSKITLTLFSLFFTSWRFAFLTLVISNLYLRDKK